MHVFWQLERFFVPLPTHQSQRLSMNKRHDPDKISQYASALWEPLTDEQRQLFAEHVTVIKPKRDEVLYREGDTPKYLYCLMRGKVSLFREGLSGQQIVRMVEPKGLFGYVAAFDNSNYRSTAIAGNDTELLLMPIKLVFHFIWENSDFAMLFLRELATLLGLSVQRTMSLTQKHIRGRLSETLLHMKDKYGVEDDGKTLAVYLSRDDLAKMSNMTTSNAIRTLSAFAQEGIIAIEGRKIKFLDIKRLEHISSLG